ncbi:MAG: hypothetical protein IPI44_06110 [Sulfuritalea sp.]|jgi:hypothetical protein|nr:hypothetical protein [Sulfuritalea sp.]MBK8118108.1 hypothetical protein [Sulfuritalea sp.]
MKQNITLSLDTRLLREAKLLAAQRHTSVSGLLAEELETIVSRESDYDRCRRAALALMQEGLPLGGSRPVRDELHDR